MKASNQRHIMFRYVLITLGILIFACMIIFKTFKTTIIDADKWEELAMKELSRVEVITPERGNILACDGSVLATNLQFYTVRIDFRSERFQMKSYKLALDSLADSLATHFPVRNKTDWKKYLERPLKMEAQGKKLPRSFRLLRNISHADYLKLRTFPFLNIPNRNKNGLIKEVTTRRKYPYGDMAALSIGIVSELSKGKRKGQVRGVSGLEKDLDSLLYGQPGVTKKIPLTKNLVNWIDTPAVAGYNVLTTIDIKMQDIVEHELNKMLDTCQAEWGLAVLMDVKTGDIKAISNLEKDKKSNRYVEGQNRAVLRYEPGSVIKTLSMLIALEDGIVTDTSRVINTGASYAYAGGRRITDCDKTSLKKVNEMLERSSNIGMTKIITSRYEQNPGAFYTRIKELGFFEPMNTGIAEAVLPRIDSLPSNRGGRIALSRQSYGYATEIPPMYMLSIYNAVANGGKYVRPRLVKGLSGNGIDTIFPVTYIRERICSEKNAAILSDMLRRVVWGAHGTGRRLRDKRVPIAGKTGTCFMVDSVTRKYDTSKKRLAFCGFFPADNPQYSCIVLTCHPRRNLLGAASTSGAVLKNIALKLYSRGMLNNSSDYKAETNTGTVPTFYAAKDVKKSNRLSSNLQIPKIKRFATPVDTMGGVPDVTGYGVRDAIAIMEAKGINVNLEGSGYVVAQNPKAGTEYQPGNTITLKLAQQ